MKIAPIPEASVLDAIPEAVLVADEDGRYVHANPAAIELLGYPLEELLGMRIGDLVDAPAPWAETEFLKLQQEGTWRGRVELRRKDGSVAVVDAMARPMKTSAGTRYVATHREVLRDAWSADVSELQQAVTRILSEAGGLREVGPVLELLAKEFAWDIAELWLVREGSVHVAEMWTNPDLDLARFEEETRATAFPAGAGLPGAVLDTGEPRWIAHGFDDPTFLRGRDTASAGLGSAYAFPLRSSDRIVGVMAFIARGRREEDPELLAALDPIGGQFAQFITREVVEEELRESRDQLAAILGGVGDGITVQDPSGRLLYANEGAAQVIGVGSPEELVAMPAEELMERFEILEDDGSPMPVEGLPGRRALMGEEGAKELVRFRVRATGEERWSLVTASPVLDARGRVRFAINIFQDVTARRRREQAERFLGEASKLLGSSLDYRTTLASVARLAVAGPADWCVAFVVEDDGLRRLEVAHADPELTPLVEELQRKYPFEATRSKAILDVVETGQPLLLPDITEEMIDASAVDEEHAAAIRRLGFRSAIAVPIPGRDSRILGALVLISSHSGRRFGEQDLAVARELGRRAGIAVAHARLYRERSHVARTLQQSLLPPELPRIPGFEIAARYLPAMEDVAGDFYDVYPLGDGAWGVMVGDVCGKGAEAASLTALARYTVRAASIEHRSPAGTLGVLNEALLRQDLGGRFCTLVVARIERDGDRVTVRLASGGHPLPMVVRAGGDVETAGRPGTLLGVLDDPMVEDRAIELEPGDAMVLFTDGVTDEFQHSGSDLRDTLGSCTGRPAPDIAESVERLALGEREAPRDDVALLVVRRTG